MIHVLNFNSEIIDFISKDDLSVIRAEYTRSKEDKSEMLNLTILSERAEYFKERNRIIIQDKNNAYREFIINRIEDVEDYIEVECDASYVEDIGKAKPIPAGQFTKLTVNQALSETLIDSGWEVGICEYGGIKSMSWTSVRTPHEMIDQLTTTYKLEPDYEIEIKNNEVVSRKVNMIQPKPLFEGKEIIYGKDLISMKRTVDMTEVKTALFAFGPEKDDGTRISTVVVDDEAQQQFNLPKRYLWGIYEPESDDQDMTLERLITLTKTELNKRKSSALSYEIEAFDLEKEYPHEIIRFGDIVRIKNSDYTPSLYAESEVVGFTHELISDELTWNFGNIVEYKEDDLLKYFRSRMEEIEKKLTNNINNSNTIITDRIEEEIDKLQQKIHKGTTPPDNPEEGQFWYDTSNPNVAVLREYVNGEWRNASAHDVEQIGGMTKEEILYNEINGTFITLSVQHAKITNEVYEALNSEYLVDNDIRAWLNAELDAINDVFGSVRDLIGSMTVETATIGKLMDVQSMIVQYRAQIYALNDALLNARMAIDERFKLLQSQYTEEKFNEAMQGVATAIGGTYNEETGQLIADIPNNDQLEEMRNTIEQSLNDLTVENQVKLQELQDGITQTNQRITTTNEELSAGISSVTKKVDGMQVGGRNLLLNSANISKAIDFTQGSYNQYFSIQITPLHEFFKKGDFITISFDVQMERGEYLRIYDDNQHWEYRFGSKIFTNIGTEKQRLTATFQLVEPTKSTSTWQLAFYNNNNGDRFTIDKIKIEEGNMPTPWTPAPEDTDKQLSDIKTTVQTQSADIQLIKDGIKLKADSSEVTKIYDNYLTPLQTQVNQQKATLDILPSQIASKVSQSQYTADMNSVVGRLNTSDTERVQLGNEIRDRVTLNEYNNMKIGTENLLLDSALKTNFSNSVSYSNVRYSLTKPLEVGKTYTFTAIFTIDGQMQSGKTTIRPYTPNDIAQEVDIIQGEIISTFVATVPSTEMIVYKDIAGITSSRTNVKVIKAMLVEGNKTGDYQQAPEETDERLTTMQTSIEQNGKDIELKASEEEFNKTKQTLSKTISEILMNTTTGVTLSYDDNGDVIDLNVGPSGVKINTNVFEINDGDVIVKDGVTTIKDAYIDKLFSKQATINYLNSVDITAKRIQAKDNKSEVNIENGTITMNRTDGYKLDMGINGITMTNPNGSTRFTMNTTFVQSAAIGTTNANVYLAAQQGYEIRAVDITQIPSDGAWDSYRYVPIRADSFIGDKLMTNAGTNLYLGSDNEVRATARGGYNGTDTVYRNVRALGYYGDFIETNSVTSGVNIYIRPDSNAEVRFTAKGTTDSYVDTRAKNIYGSSLITRDTGNLYLGTDDGVRITGRSLYNGGSPIWRNLAANGLYANFLDINPNTSATNLYLRADNEVRITKRNTTDSYIPIRAASATWTSSERYKYDIEDWNIDVLDHLVNRIKLYSYKLYSEQDDESDRIRHGVILERETPDEWKNGDGVDSYEMTAWSIKAIQELAKKVQILEAKSEEK